MIDVTKKYTCGGKQVFGLRIETHNSAGSVVTYPVKGSVLVQEKPRRVEYRIWSIDGVSEVVWGRGHNLVEATDQAIELDSPKEMV